MNIINNHQHIKDHNDDDAEHNHHSLKIWTDIRLFVQLFYKPGAENHVLDRWVNFGAV